MEVLYWLESIRMPGLNEAMLLITRLGEETVFLLIAMILFWCVDKRRGYYLMAVCFVGSVISLFLKLLVRAPRPWVVDPNFTILEQAREAAESYSFPSAHTQIAVGTLGALAHTTERRSLRVLFVVLAVLVGFSRMYVGVHTPADVLASAAIAVLLVILMRPIADRWGQKEIMTLFAAMILLGLGLLAYAALYPFVGVDPYNLDSVLKNGSTMMGCILGMAILYPLEKKYIRFDTRAVWWAQVLKVVLGMALLLLVKEGLQAPLELILPVYPARVVRYCLIMIAAGVVWPLSFRRFGKLGRKP